MEEYEKEEKQNSHVEPLLIQSPNYKINNSNNSNNSSCWKKCCKLFFILLLIIVIAYGVYKILINYIL